MISNFSIFNIIKTVFNNVMISEDFEHQSIINPMKYDIEIDRNICEKFFFPKMISLTVL